jgi:hypothetical protein
MRVNQIMIWKLVLLAGIPAAQAAVYSPRVFSPHSADTYSLKTFAEFPHWRDLQGDAKVFEIFKYVVDRRTGVYPLGVPAWEGNETLAEFGAVTDPVKMLNVYPIGHCGTLGPAAAGIMEGMGVGPARTLIIPGWHHVAAEVFYANSWHYLDLDVRAVFRRDDGSLASIAEARTNAALWRGPNNPLFFPLDSLENVRAAYMETPVQHRYGVAAGGHTMDFVLRHGETFTRWWQPQGGRWNQHVSYAAKPFPREIVERAPRGPKCKHESFTIHTHGNGRFVYRPNLTARSADFEDGVYDFRNVEPSGSGLTLKSRGEGYSIFEIRSPYVIVPLVGDLDSTADDREASIVTVDASGARLLLSLDNALTWQPVDAAKGPVDLTPYVSGRYHYLLKIDLRGEPQKAVVRSLEITTWVQVHPASLPALRKGKNTMRLITGDHYGMETRLLAIQPDAADRDDFLKHLVERPQDYDPARRTGRVRGSFVAKVQAPPATRIAWFSAGASFAANVGAPNSTHNTISYAAGEPRNFVEIYRAAIPSDQSHWHYNVDREVKLAQPGRNLFVRYTGEPAVNNIRIYAHCLEERPRASAALLITHGWSENGVQKSKPVQIEPGGGYEIEAATDPVDEFIELAVPSRLKGTR